MLHLLRDNNVTSCTSGYVRYLLFKRLANLKNKHNVYQQKTIAIVIVMPSLILKTGKQTSKKYIKYVSELLYVFKPQNDMIQLYFDSFYRSAESFYLVSVNPQNAILQNGVKIEVNNTVKPL